MSRAAAFAYAGARLQARHGDRPGPGEWERLGRVADFGRYLQLARGTGLGPFVRAIGRNAGAHEVERLLRLAFRGHVAEVAAWQPAQWRAGVRWVSALAELPFLGHLLAEDGAFPWMDALPETGALARRPPEARPRALATGPLAPLAPAGREGPTLLERWLRHWRYLLPAAPGAFGPPLAHLERSLRRFRGEVARGSGEAPEGHLEAELTHLFRQHTREPAGAYAHLGLTALDLERARSHLLRRRLFPGEAP